MTAHKTTTHGPALSLTEARAIRADLAHHCPASVLSALQVIEQQSPDTDEVACAVALRRVMQGEPA